MQLILLDHKNNVLDHRNKWKEQTKYPMKFKNRIEAKHHAVDTLRQHNYKIKPLHFLKKREEVEEKIEEAQLKTNEDEYNKLFGLYQQLKQEEEGKNKMSNIKRLLLYPTLGYIGYIIFGTTLMIDSYHGTIRVDGSLFTVIITIYIMLDIFEMIGERND